MISKWKIIGVIISSTLLIIYLYLDIFQSDISIIIKLLPSLIIVNQKGGKYIYGTDRHYDSSVF